MHKVEALIPFQDGEISGKTNGENMKENIYNIIKEIREKIKNDPKYLHPCNKEFQEDIKRFEFKNGNEFVSWMQQNGILLDPLKDNRRHHANTYNRYNCGSATEYMNLCAQKFGYKDRRERRNEYEWNNGIRSPISENRNHHSYSGVEIAQKIVAKMILPMILGNIKDEMGHNNPGFDYIMENDIKIDIKSAQLKDNRHNFIIMENNIADYFLLIGFNYGYNRKLEILHIWLFNRDELVRERRFFKRSGFQIINDEKELSEFSKYELRKELEEFKKICPSLEV